MVIAEKDGKLHWHATKHTVIREQNLTQVPLVQGSIEDVSESQVSTQLEKMKINKVLGPDELPIAMEKCLKEKRWNWRTAIFKKNFPD